VPAVAQAESPLAARLLLLLRRRTFHPATLILAVLITLFIARVSLEMAASCWMLSVDPSRVQSIRLILITICILRVRAAAQRAFTGFYLIMGYDPGHNWPMIRA